MFLLGCDPEVFITDGNNGVISNEPSNPFISLIEKSPAKGVWHGKLEVCYIVEIIADEKKYNVIYNICKQLNIELQQESILMTDEHTHTQLI